MPFFLDHHRLYYFRRILLDFLRIKEFYIQKVNKKPSIGVESQSMNEILFFLIPLSLKVKMFKKQFIHKSLGTEWSYWGDLSPISRGTCCLQAASYSITAGENNLLLVHPLIHRQNEANLPTNDSQGKTTNYILTIPFCLKRPVQSWGIVMGGDKSSYLFSRWGWVDK